MRAERCDKIFREKASGKDIKNRPQLEKAIDELGKGDIIVLAEWDRATRSMMDGVHIIERIHARGALLKVLDKPHLDLTTPIGRGFIAFLSALAEDERQRIVKRANDGRKAAKARGARFGRKPQLHTHQQKEALSRLLAGESARSVGVNLPRAPCDGFEATGYPNAVDVSAKHSARDTVNSTLPSGRGEPVQATDDLPACVHVRERPGSVDLAGRLAEIEIDCGGVLALDVGPSQARHARPAH